MSSTKAPPSTSLRPRARLLKTLGEELISNEVVAVIELVKNSYDADATKVLIRFVEPLEPGKGMIEVIDDGHGMSLDTVKSVWMEPATPSKRGNTRRSEKFKRRYLGEKGIGRFASSRLAHELEIFTRRNNDEQEVHALFDWRQFENEEKYLDEITILWDVRKPAEICKEGAIQFLWKSEKQVPSHRKFTHGTVLRMIGLKQKWEDKQFEDLRRGLARLISPKISKSDERDFEVELLLPEQYSKFSDKVESPTILKHPHYIIKGSIDSVGKYKITYKVLAEGESEPIKGQFIRVKNSKGQYVFRGVDDNDEDDADAPSDIRLVECGPLEIELRIWDRDDLGNVMQKTHSTIKDVRRDLDAVAGVNIFRDNFRVLPYGEPNDDWLRLDIRRVQNPTLRLSNNQIYGVVQISADSNPNLKDQSNREGLDENQALRDIREIITSILAYLESKRYNVRPRNKTTSNKTAGGLFSGFDLKPLSDYIAKQLPEDKAAQELVKKTDELFAEQLKEIQSVLARYQRLATLGQLIDHVLHEGRQPIASINNEAELGLLDVEKIEKIGDKIGPKFGGRFTSIRKQGDVLATAFRRMEPFGGRKRGRPEQLYLEDVIRDAFNVYENDIAQLKVKTSLPKTQTLVRIDPAEIQEVIINLLQNGLHWLQQVNENKREIAVSVDRKAADHLDILFSDSGPGVPKQNRESIFEPYFSTKAEGVGLGLAIAGEIVSDYYDGALELLERGPLKGANFLVTLRKRI